MDHVAKALRDFLWLNKGKIGVSGICIDSVLAEVRQALTEVLHYQPEVLMDGFPVICVGIPESGESRWFATDGVMETAYRVPIYSYMILDDAKDPSTSIMRLAKAVQRSFEDRFFEEIPVPLEEHEADHIQDLPVLYYYDPPVQGNSVEYVQVGEQGPFLKKATTTWSGWEKRQIPTRCPN